MRLATAESPTSILRHMALRTPALLLLLLLLVLAAPLAHAQGPIRVGMIAPMSGDVAGSGQEMLAGARAFQRGHGDSVLGRPVRLFVEDSAGAGPEAVRRMAQSLLDEKHVSFLIGFADGASAVAVAPMAGGAHIPMLVLGAPGADLTGRTRYLMRLSFTWPQVLTPLAHWAAKNGVRSVFPLSSASPGDSQVEAAFRRVCADAGVRALEGERVVSAQRDFTSVLRRIQAARPDAVFLAMSQGEQAAAFMTAFSGSSLVQSGVRVLAAGDLTDERGLDAMGEAMLGIVTAYPYSLAHDSEENSELLEAFPSSAPPGMRPNLQAVAGWDAMAAIYQAVAQSEGDVRGEKMLQALRGLALRSPRGPIWIDARTRNVVQTIYLRRVQKVERVFYNIEISQVPQVNDQGR